MNGIARLLTRSRGGHHGRRLLEFQQQQQQSRRGWCFAADTAGSREHIARLVGQSKVVVFMKGVPEQPLCGFSNAVVQILRMHGVQEYQSHNVLEDDDLRKGIKEYTDWPTIPQIFFNGEFIGGCDIMLQMHQNGELVEELEKLGIRSALLNSPQDTE